MCPRQAKGNVGNEFERTLCEVVEDARKTTGCMRYEWYRAPTSPRGTLWRPLKSGGKSMLETRAREISDTNAVDSLPPVLNGLQPAPCPFKPSQSKRLKVVYNYLDVRQSVSSSINKAFVIYSYYKTGELTMIKFYGRYLRYVMSTLTMITFRITAN